MNRLLSLRKATLTLAALTALGLALPASAGPPLPFKGYANAVITSPPTSPVLTASATGEATHLGFFTRTERLLLNPETGAFTGSLVFTASNGDKLCARFAGGFTPLGTAVGKYRFIGGTGRFEKATGEAAFTAVPAGPGRFTITFQGTIQY